MQHDGSNNSSHAYNTMPAAGAVMHATRCQQQWYQYSETKLQANKSQERWLPDQLQDYHELNVLPCQQYSVYDTLEKCVMD
jgi:hypothetical protein